VIRARTLADVPKRTIAPLVNGRVRLRLLEDGQPRRNLKYTLEVEGQTFSGRTDGDGKLEHKIPSKASVGRLITAEDSYALNIGKLDPVTEITGIQERLKNLGYLGDAADGVLTENTKAALRAFQEKHHLEADGEITEQTRNKLAELHGT
jgi:N-acetylmuramoyl-L-alanine amidase